MLPSRPDSHTESDADDFARSRVPSRRGRLPWSDGNVQHLGITVGDGKPELPTAVAETDEPPTELGRPVSQPDDQLKESNPQRAAPEYAQRHPPPMSGTLGSSSLTDVPPFPSKDDLKRKGRAALDISPPPMKRHRVSTSDKPLIGSILSRVEFNSRDPVASQAQHTVTRVETLQDLEELQRPGTSSSGCSGPSIHLNTSRQSRCHHCKETSSTKYDPLVRCGTCSRHFHDACRKPPAVQGADTASWRCYRCVSKNSGLPLSTSNDAVVESAHTLKPNLTTPKDDALPAYPQLQPPAHPPVHSATSVEGNSQKKPPPPQLEAQTTQPGARKSPAKVRIQEMLDRRRARLLEQGEAPKPTDNLLSPQTSPCASRHAEQRACENGSKHSHAAGNEEDQARGINPFSSGVGLRVEGLPTHPLIKPGNPLASSPNQAKLRARDGKSSRAHADDQEESEGVRSSSSNGNLYAPAGNLESLNTHATLDTVSHRRGRRPKRGQFSIKDMIGMALVAEGEALTTDRVSTWIYHTFPDVRNSDRPNWKVGIGSVLSNHKDFQKVAIPGVRAAQWKFSRLADKGLYESKLSEYRAQFSSCSSPVTGSDGAASSIAKHVGHQGEAPEDTAASSVESSRRATPLNPHLATGVQDDGNELRSPKKQIRTQEEAVTLLKTLSLSASNSSASTKEAENNRKLDDVIQFLTTQTGDSAPIKEPSAFLRPFLHIGDIKDYEPIVIPEHQSEPATAADGFEFSPAQGDDSDRFFMPFEPKKRQTLTLGPGMRTETDFFKAFLHLAKTSIDGMTQAEKEAKIEEIKKRPSRKATLGKPKRLLEPSEQISMTKITPILHNGKLALRDDTPGAGGVIYNPFE